MEKRETPTCWSVDFLLTPLTTLMENKSRSKSRMQQQNIKLQSVINTLSRPERDLLLDTLSKSQLQSLSQHLLHEGWVVTSKKSPEGKDCPRYNLYFRYSGSGQDCDPVRVQPKSSVRKGHGLKGGGQIPARSYYKLLKVPNIIVHKLLLMFFTNFVTLFYIKQLAITLIWLVFCIICQFLYLAQFEFSHHYICNSLNISFILKCSLYHRLPVLICGRPVS